MWNAIAITRRMLVLPAALAVTSCDDAPSTPAKPASAASPAKAASLDDPPAIVREGSSTMPVAAVAGGVSGVSVRLKGKGKVKLMLQGERGQKLLYDAPMTDDEQLVSVPQKDLDQPGEYVLRLNAEDAIADVLIGGDVRLTKELRNFDGYDFRFEWPQ